MGDFPVWVTYAFADGQIDASACELTHFLDRAVKAVDDPSLLGMVFAVELQEVGGGPDVVDDEGFLVLLG